MRHLIEDRNANEYVRSAAFTGITTLVSAGSMPRENALDYFRSLFDGKLDREASFAWSELVCSTLKICPGDLADRCRWALEEGLVDRFAVSEDSIEKALSLGEAGALERLKQSPHHRFVEDVVRETEWWACFKVVEHPHFPDPQAVLRTRKPPKPLDPAPARPLRLVPQMSFHGVADFGTQMGRQFLQVLGRLGGEQHFVSHSGYIVARFHRRSMSSARLGPLPLPRRPPCGTCALRAVNRRDSDDAAQCRLVAGSETWQRPESGVISRRRPRARGSGPARSCRPRPEPGARRWSGRGRARRESSIRPASGGSRSGRPRPWGAR